MLRQAQHAAQGAWWCCFANDPPLLPVTGRLASVATASLGSCERVLVQAKHAPQGAVVPLTRQGPTTGVNDGAARCRMTHVRGPHSSAVATILLVALAAQHSRPTFSLHSCMSALQLPVHVAVQAWVRLWARSALPARAHQGPFALQANALPLSYTSFYVSGDGCGTILALRQSAKLSPRLPIGDPG